MPHIHDKIDFTVEVFIVYKDKILLRMHDKLNIWLSVGGHIELDEDSNQAALREVKEEIGLEVKLYSGNKLYAEDNDKYHELIPPMFLNRHFITDIHEHVTLTYFATTDTDQITPDEIKEVSSEIKWFTKEELENHPDMKDNVRFYALKALDLLGN